MVPATIVVGTQWGDEGKGKFTDLLSKEMSMVVRYQGGHNAGHTLVVDAGEPTAGLTPSPMNTARPRQFHEAGRRTRFDT